ncbi:CHAT domain-containing protein [Sphaerisporangium siamense]|uniref:ATP/maltotriose-dependent transcriptional regulator MalT n=1 Tax=Sphaerisporangium siamense TaxID=795645 RepID=A0A7W7DCR5_9ACTN|nr:CHAT domain-containing tetratricopeptide repeat protein [Sphaerisporangium siamense]MBB4704412.1 ATP/maltotriose-dependent transcriptional regulator MalT [Sphaerisporangium siamense]
MLRRLGGAVVFHAYRKTLMTAQEHMLAGDFRKARFTALLALRAATDTFGPDDERTAFVLAALASVDIAEGDLDAAAERISAARRVLDGLPDAEPHARALLLGQHAAVQGIAGRHTAALEDMRAAVALITSAPGAPPFAAALLHGDLVTSAPGVPPFAAALLHAGLGAAEAEAGLPRDALRSYRTALAVVRAARDDAAVLEPQILIDIALIHRDLGDRYRAGSLADEAMAAAAAVPAVHGAALARMRVTAALIKRGTGDLEAAEHLIGQVEDFWSGVPGHQSERVAATIVRAAIAADRGDPAEAHRVLAGLDGVVSGGPAVVAGHGLALTAYMAGDLAEASRRLERLEQESAAAFGPGHLQTAQTLVLAAALSSATGEHGRALDLVTRATAAEARIQWTSFGAGGRDVHGAIMDRLAASLHVELTVALAAEGHDPRATATGLAAVLRRKGGLREAFAVLHTSRARESWEELREVSGRILAATTGHPEGALVSELAALYERQEELEARLADGVPEEALRARARHATPAAVLGALPAGAALLELFRWVPFDLRAGVSRGPEHAEYLGYLLAAGEARLIRFGPAAPIDTAIRHWNHAPAPDVPAPPRDVPGSPGVVAAPGDVSVSSGIVAAASGGASGVSDVLGELSGMLAGPLLAALDGVDVRRLYVAPDGALGLVPWEILTGPDGVPLVDRLSLSYLTAARTLLGGGPRTGPPGDPLVIGGPDFGHAPPDDATDDVPDDVPDDATDGVARVAGIAFAALPGTVREAKAVARLLGVSPLLGAEATRAAVLGARSPRVLHLATHGFFLDAPGGASSGLWAMWDAEPAPEGVPRRRVPWYAAPRPLLRCGVALAGANTPDPPGFVTGEDILALDLRATELVVLSACDTGRGEAHAGDGILGLAHAFATAGARHVLLSLWAVNDHLAARLMRVFHEHLTAGASPLAALRAAQHRIRVDHPDPRLWAGFVLYGD